MRPVAIKAIGVAAALAVVGAGVVDGRALLLEEGGGTVVLHAGPAPAGEGPAVRVHAGAGVRVNVEWAHADSAQGWPEGAVLVDTSWRATLARPVVEPPGDGGNAVLARCENPVGLGRCAVWLTVLVPRPGVTVTVWQAPGAAVTGVDEGIVVDVRQ